MKNASALPLLFLAGRCDLPYDAPNLQSRAIRSTSRKPPRPRRTLTPVGRLSANCVT